MAALEALNTHPQVSVASRSRCYRTAPVGCAVGDGFLNAAAVVWTSLDPQQLLAWMQSVESQFGRERTCADEGTPIATSAIADDATWQSRTLDLDLIQYGDCQQRGTGTKPPEDLVLPHPAAWYRRFVVDPACEIAGDWVYPGLGTTWQALREQLTVRPLTVWVPAALHECAAAYASEELQVRIGSGLERELVLAATLDSPRRIELPSRLAPEQAVRNVLTAALDKPHVVTE